MRPCRVRDLAGPRGWLGLGAGHGHGQSACTIFLSIRNVCITPGATLLFHAGGDMRSNRYSAASTQHMLEAYNPALRQYLTDNHFMDTFTFHTISARDMISRFGYPACR